MMCDNPHVSQESPVPMPQPLRVLAYAVIVSVLAVSLYVCVQTAVMLYDFYLIIQWLGGLAQ